tara:strand:- start:1085 stop:2326 length:1242 start_codon:yes stop_codon:yes gene_type:complete
MIISEDFLIKQLSILIYLLPLFLITGPFLPDLTVVISSIIVLFLIIKKKDYFYVNNFFFIFFNIWCAYIILRSLLSYNPLLSLESSLFYFRFGIMTIVIWFIINNNIKFKIIFFYSLLLTYFLVIFHGYIDYFFNFNFFYLGPDGPRLSGLFNDRLIMGSFLSRLFPLLFALGYLFFKDNKKLMCLIFIIFILTDVLIYLSGERVAFFNLALFTLIVIILSKDWVIFRILTIFFSLIFIIIFSYLEPSSKDRMVSHTIEQIGLSSDISEPKYIFSYEHQGIFIASINIFLDNKMFGIGPKLFREVCLEPKYYSPHRCSTHSHNFYLQLLSETGLIGVIPLIALYIFFLFLIFKHFLNKFFKRKYILNDYQIYLISPFIINFFPIIPSGSFFNNWLSIVYFFPVGFLLHNYYKK